MGPSLARASLLAFALVAAACQTCGGEQTEVPTPSEPVPERLTLVTLNVLATPVRAEARTNALLAVLEDSADVIALQEVAPWFAERLLAAEWVEPLHLASRDGQPLMAGGQMLLSRFPIERAWVEPLPHGHRTVLFADLDLGGSRLRVATTHLESPLDAGAIRAEQLAQILERLEEVEEAILLGDLNFGDGEEPETRTLGEHVVDPWLDLRPGEPGHTWDMERNPLAAIGAFVGEGSRRLDRVLLRGSWRARSIRIFGDEPVGEVTLLDDELRQIRMPNRAPTNGDSAPITLFPSDHFGLRVELAR